MAQYRVQTAQLRAVADTLSAGATASRAMAEHPGVVRGRGQDSGDLGVRAAAEQFADRWEHGLARMSDEAQRLADVLTLVADTYDRADAAAAAGLARWA